MIVFDLTSQTSVDNIKQWVEFVHQHSSMPFIIVGNKEDLVDEQIITPEEALKLASSVQSQFFATSAKNGNNVDLAFRQLECIAVEYYTNSGRTATVVIDPELLPPPHGCSC
ncbi:GTP-binding protein, putative [Trichomonas vaginalis G3]|uniref:GTP-binding protein, putative n=1 Tax=Trichomonas vaginalis (strain ATCC PRA-98 / G3) TaxID=412133 RepID=A2DF01_TRIV3|nr:GMP binding [Trichomonas vaginalis G3]EAY20993.1 GTP-binding protein, putative [Trichomonas vaginalis G3]KAI5519164.1 GMP binding [Trichomonas vaginalis G3]|eukprot:XP_001581979.1 GTP-binding protein [Trichomonas vaginalis G3]